MMYIYSQVVEELGKCEYRMREVKLEQGVWILVQIFQTYVAVNTQWILGYRYCRIGVFQKV